MALKYWSTTGSNLNPGSEGLPYLTLSHAVAQLSAGDTLFGRNGNYTGDTNRIDSEVYGVPSGNAGARITIQAYPGETVTITPPDGLQAIRLGNGAIGYLTIKNLILDGINQTIGGNPAQPGAAGPDLVYIRALSHHNRFEGCEIKRNAANGVAISHSNGAAHHNEFVDCFIHDNGRGDYKNAGYGVYISGGDDNLIEGCEISGNNGYGVHINSGVANEGNRNITRKCTFHGNRVIGTLGAVGGSTAFAYVCMFGGGNQLYDCLFFENQGGAFIYFDVRDLLVANNTFFNNGNETNGQAGIALQYYNRISPPRIQNNISYGNVIDLIDYGDFDGLFNSPTCSYNHLGIAPTGITNSNGQSGDPLFVNSGADDLHLQAGSVARNAGTDLSADGITYDFDNVGLPQGAGYPIGAYAVPDSSPIQTLDWFVLHASMVLGPVRLGAEYQPYFAGAPFGKTPSWAALFPDVLPRRWRPQGIFSYAPLVNLPAAPTQWAPKYPDLLWKPPWRRPTQLSMELFRATFVTFGWKSVYADIINRRRIHPSALTHSVLGLQATGTTKIEWNPTYPNLHWRTGFPVRMQQWLVQNLDPIPNPPSPELAWGPKYQDWVPRAPRTTWFQSTFEDPQIMPPSPALAWRVIAPDLIWRQTMPVAAMPSEFLVQRVIQPDLRMDWQATAADPMRRLTHQAGLSVRPPEVAISPVIWATQRHQAPPLLKRAVTLGGVTAPPAIQTIGSNIAWQGRLPQVMRRQVAIADMMSLTIQPVLPVKNSWCVTFEDDAILSPALWPEEVTLPELAGERVRTPMLVNEQVC